MSKHTPGPWTWVGNSDLHGGSPPDSVIFCTAEYDDGYYGELHCEEPDRRLIAAAPVLLEAAKNLLQVFDAPFPETAIETRKEALRTAISAAEEMS